MEFSYLKKNDSGIFDEKLSIRENFEMYFKYKKWFIFTVLICLFGAFFKLYYSVPTYIVSASILIKDQNKGKSSADISTFEELGLFGSGGNVLENELEILKSRRLMSRVVNELKLNIRYFKVNSSLNDEIYQNIPFIVDVDLDSLGELKYGGSFFIEKINGDQFYVYDEYEELIGTHSFGNYFKVNLGDEDDFQKIDVRIVNNDGFKFIDLNTLFRIDINTIDGTVNSIMSRLEIILPEDVRYSKVLKLSLTETIIGRGAVILNNLIEQYNADGINDKDLLAKSTTQFLDDRLTLLANELDAIEISAAQFKASKRMVNDDMSANIYLESSSLMENRILKANTQLQLINYLIGELNNSEANDLLPSDIGLSDNSVSQTVNAYNQLLLKRNRILKSSSEINPIVQNLDSELNELKGNLLNNLRSHARSETIAIETLTKESSKISSRIASVPKNEKDYKDIVRDQETKNSLYLFLLQKREESILSNAVQIEKAKIIDSGYSDGKIVSPNKKAVLLGAIFIGLLIPFLIIYLKDLLNTKIINESDLSHLKLPFLGDIPLSSSKSDIDIKDGVNNQITEAFRYIRTNIGFLIENKKTGNTILITSTRSGEGKTMASINLAKSLALTGKKTVLIELDLRAPKLSKYLKKNKSDNGVTNFIKNDRLDLEDIVFVDEKIKNLDFIDSGDIPPNPVELLMHKRVEELFMSLKSKYEFIVIDSAPIGLVTDCIQISKFVDLSIYLIKYNFIDKRMLKIPQKLNLEGKLKNMSLLINGSASEERGYGYGYGYGERKSKKLKWFKNIF